MDAHSDNFSSAIANNKKIEFPFEESTKSRILGKLRYWWSWFVVGSIVLLVAPILLLIYRFKKNREGFYSWCDWGARTWLRASGTKVNVSGLENLEEGRQYVFVSNHRSYLDTAALYSSAGRRIGLVAKKELLKVPIFGPGMEMANIIAIDRSNQSKARRSMDRAREIMKSGYSFGVFAEGTRALRGELLPFKKGAIHLAFQTKSPIIPVAFLNTDRLMAKGTGVAYPGTIELCLFPAIETDGLSTREDIMEVLVETRGVVGKALGDYAEKLLKP